MCNRELLEAPQASRLTRPACPPAPGRRLNRSLCKTDLVNVEIVTRKKVHMVLTQRFERAPQDLAHNLAHESEQTEMELVDRTCDTFHSGHQTSCAWLLRISGFLDIKFDIVDTVFGTAVSELLSPS